MQQTTPLPSNQTEAPTRCTISPLSSGAKGLRSSRRRQLAAIRSVAPSWQIIASQSGSLPASDGSATNAMDKLAIMRFCRRGDSILSYAHSSMVPDRRSKTSGVPCVRLQTKVSPYLQPNTIELLLTNGAEKLNWLVFCATIGGYWRVSSYKKTAMMRNRV